MARNATQPQSPTVASRKSISTYLAAYILAYREEYVRATSLPPTGAGLPKIEISPYLSPGSFKCILARDGVIIFKESNGPPSWWDISGPAWMIDYEPTMVPQSKIDLRAELNSDLKQRNGGRERSSLYRIVSKELLPPHIFNGAIDVAGGSIVSKLPDGTCFQVYELPDVLIDVCARITFGGIGRIINIHLGDGSTPFWHPHIVTHLGFFTANEENFRFIEYMEIHTHRDSAAWHPKSINVRVVSDVRRDFARLAGRPEPGSTLSFRPHSEWVDQYQRSLFEIEKAITKFADLLEYQSDGLEEVFHQFLNNNPVLLDIYATFTSKPRLKYPNGEKSSLEKSYVEPDFIAAYPDGTYRLIELEKPSKNFRTDAGHPRQDINQAAFQIAEWKDYIATHYQLIKDRFPNISERSPSTLILSRDRQRSFQSKDDLQKYIATLKRMYNVDEILTYDDILRRAQSLHSKLSAMGI